MRVRLQNMGVAVIGAFMVVLSCREAKADSAEYLAELQLLGFDEFFTEQVAGLNVKVTNRGYLTWPSVASDPSLPVRISYHWLAADGKVVIHDGLRTDLPQELRTGESLRIRALILAPAIPGTYTLVLDLVREHVTWFADRGSPLLKISAVEVQGAGEGTWHRAQILFIVAGVSFLLFLMGIGTRKFLAADLPIALSPLLGVSIIVVLSYYASLLGISMIHAKWGILAVGVGALGAAVVARKSVAQLGRRESLLLILFTLVMLLVALLPLWDFGRPSSVRNTYASYFVTMSEYWKYHCIQEIPVLDPY
jgi:hypothetical protein